MHETGIVRSLIHEVERAASGHGDGGSKVLSVTVRMGALCPFSESHLYEHFLHDTKGTVAENAWLIIERDACPEDMVELNANAQDLILLSIEVEDVLARAEAASGRIW
jgi:Zn finger protein HypA/HybF involved in hydrogenase expression